MVPVVDPSVDLTVVSVDSPWVVVSISVVVCSAVVDSPSVVVASEVVTDPVVVSFAVVVSPSVTSWVVVDPSVTVDSDIVAVLGPVVDAVDEELPHDAVVSEVTNCLDLFLHLGTPMVRSRQSPKKRKRRTTRPLVHILASGLLLSF